jgi:hypothetical protein
MLMGNLHCCVTWLLKQRLPHPSDHFRQLTGSSSQVSTAHAQLAHDRLDGVEQSQAHIDAVLSYRPHLQKHYWTARHKTSRPVVMHEHASSCWDSKVTIHNSNQPSGTGATHVSSDAHTGCLNSAALLTQIVQAYHCTTGDRSGDRRTTPK